VPGPTASSSSIVARMSPDPITDALRCSREGNEGVPCKFAETRVPTELGRARSPCYTELRSQITQFRILSVGRRCGPTDAFAIEFGYP